MDGRIAIPDTEVRIFGPPGTGKTQRAAEAIARAVKRYGRPNSVMGCSLTKTAALSLIERVKRLSPLPVNKANFGTVHALALRALRRTDSDVAIFADKAVSTAWNDEHPYWAVTIDSRDGEVDQRSDGAGDRLFADVTTWRSSSRLVTPHSPTPANIDPEAVLFYRRHEEWKKANGVVDFTDMVVLCLNDEVAPPDGVKFAVYDEAQDMTAIEYDLARMWGARMDLFYLMGDDDQSIYAWRGGRAEELFEFEIPDSRNEVLSLSYRMRPLLVDRMTAFAERAISRRKKKVFSAAHDDEPGAVEHIACTWQEPGDIVDRASAGAANGRASLIIAPAAYQLTKIISDLREKGVPFANPYRVSNGQWNPLKSRSVAVAGLYDAVRYCRYVDDMTTISFRALAASIGYLKKTALPQGAVDYVEKMSKSDSMVPVSVLWEEAPEEVAAWLMSALKADAARSCAFPILAARASGIDAVRSPLITVGTIHSVKGGEADDVYLIEEFSPKAAKCSTDDELARVLYVGATRAKFTLFVSAGKGYGRFLSEFFGF